MKILTKKKEKEINDNIYNISKSYLCASRKLTEIEQLVLKAKSPNSILASLFFSVIVIR